MGRKLGAGSIEGQLGMDSVGESLGNAYSIPRAVRNGKKGALGFHGNHPS